MNLEMTPLEIIGLKRDLLPFLDVLRELGCMHIDNVMETPDVTARSLTPDAQISHQQEELGVLSARVDGLVDLLGCYSHKQAGETEPAAGRDLDTLREGLNTLLPQVQSLTRHKDELESELASLPLYETTLRTLLPLVPAAAYEPNNAVMGVLVNRANIAVLDMVSKQVLEITMGAASAVSSEVNETTQAMLIVLPKRYESEIEDILGQSDVSRLRLPPGMEKGLPDVVLGTIRRRMGEIPTEIEKVKAQLSALATKWCGQLAEWQAVLRDGLEGYQVLAKFGETEMTFVLTGWTPTKELKKLKERLSEEFGELLLVQELNFGPATQARAPVVLENPSFSQPFEGLVKMLELPRYNRIDPTLLMSLFMPLFFGLMLGDIGYGAILLLISLGMMRKFRKGMLHDLLRVIAVGSGWAILFGILFGEVFGTLGESLGLHPIWMARDSAEDVQGLLLLSVAIGAGHTLLGLVLGVWEALRDRSRTHLLERGGMLVGLIGLFFIAGVLGKFLPDGFMTPSVMAVILGIVLLSASLGWLGIAVGWIEFIGLIGNVLSYLRIAAIGLASVYLAKVANNMVGIAGNLVVGLIIAVLIHAFNLAMGTFSPTIHSLRLHYVEFFRKFYVGGGRSYEPFRSRIA